jgi:hypothetical protein
VQRKLDNVGIQSGVVGYVVRDEMKYTRWRYEKCVGTFGKQNSACTWSGRA